MTACTENYIVQFFQKYSPYGHVRDAHLLRYQGLAVVYYGGTLECLANELLSHVKYPD